MNKLVSAATFGALLALAGCSDSSDQAAQQSPQQDDVALDSDAQKLGYSIGMTMAHNLQETVPNLELDAFKQAIDDVYAGRDPKLSDQDAEAALTQFQQQQISQQQQQQQQAAEENQRAGEAFLADNAEQEGVQTTASGLQYKVIESGDGPQPNAEDTVQVNYEGTLLDGTVFDSSFERGEPVTFKVNEVIQGWQEALQLMHEGDEWMVYVPANLAYGPAGVGPIGPNETLSFKVQLLKVNPDTP
ncbi:FKBP-type peptidyl-prolyl cis-trans isomerase [Halotalea alkalilenta]|uniref:FKBP-type peptidyl-prolyl cis-trans isomerase n=1 Tax=Halotalea alkalilenta TaxID=376489 RepID=UPI000484FFBA|nr:FKBP-type peptidyl-prolyl cis-trans isomerase [Halotalea alkalilenta]